MSYEFDYLVFIGRFQPFHQGHKFVINQALTLAKTVLVLIGSANSPRTTKNPFSFDERESMILGAFDDECRIMCLPVDDNLYNDQKWLSEVQALIYHVVGDDDKVGVVGYHKDKSSYYLSLFPSLGCVNLPNYENLSATPIRKRYFDCGEIDENLPDNVARFLDKFKNSEDYLRLQREYNHIAEYQLAWQHAPYPPVFVTADALVVQAGHILLIERGGDYGHGLYALAGGFLDTHETLFECVVRELYEETGLVIDPNALKSEHTFDAPDRSARGRTITTVFYFELSGDELPALKAGDDASRAFWLPLGKLDGKMMFEDHHSVILKVLGL
ncbi:bifunctional nicotinamide-nucleotide adenylyltransferase/Nudix hydroxylase [Moraxella sp. VT-16-12]|uniref:bifunctional nicotinamide-nucleotide adenylyltransferase/Nudix hydroxylase n=1 Tax=Moraxella sp. VT-16-12 TaxID=2014877 RepID=UPI000B7F967F|nr:bifunctional nicotinamide-nucleotide adenylyltransferase/Nudix hydroxylase [Moraxella sp. VT-16-12]TWV83945.1 bifunctional nicotinamide-nucleotide adenylyltransferase/Nudix hydroxylase [Moraxella sp. VT-16-12]